MTCTCLSVSVKRSYLFAPKGLSESTLDATCRTQSIDTRVFRSEVNESMRARLLYKKWSLVSARQFCDVIFFIAVCGGTAHCFGFTGGVSAIEAVGVVGVMHECFTTSGVNILWSNVGGRRGMVLKTSSIGICRLRVAYMSAAHSRRRTFSDL